MRWACTLYSLLCNILDTSAVAANAAPSAMQRGLDTPCPLTPFFISSLLSDSQRGLGRVFAGTAGRCPSQLTLPLFPLHPLSEAVSANSCGPSCNGCQGRPQRMVNCTRGGRHCTAHPRGLRSHSQQSCLGRSFDAAHTAAVDPCGRCPKRPACRAGAT